MSDPGAALFESLHLFIIERFLTSDECAILSDAMRNAPAADATVARAGSEYHVDEKLRRTRRVNIESAGFVQRLDALRDAAAKHFDVELESTESPQFLLYREGDFFVRHADRDRAGANRRAVSIIVFINDDYTGGALQFFGEVNGETLALSIAPAAGLLIGFRSETIHEVEKVTSGERMTAVSWFTYAKR